MIYLDSAATSYYRPPEVAQAMMQALSHMGNGSRGNHALAIYSSRIIFETRQLIDELFQGDGPGQVVFTANATASLNIAIKGLLEPGDRVVTTVMEHNSVLRPLYELEEKGVDLTIVGCRNSGGENSRELGRLDMAALQAAIVPGIKAVVCTHASNLTGNVADIKTIGKWCRAAGAYFIVDASQTAGIIPVSMKESYIDVLCFTGHKGLLGPQGTGGLCVRSGLALRPLLTGGSGIKTFEQRHPQAMPEALEAGTLNGHGIAGLNAGLRWLKEQGIAQTSGKKDRLARMFYRQVKALPGYRCYGDYASYEPHQGGQSERIPMVTLNYRETDSGRLSDFLSHNYEIYTRSGGHCAPLMHESLGTRNQGAVRFSFSAFNTREQIRQVAAALEQYAQ